MTSYTIKMADMPDEVEFSDDWLDEMIRSSVARIEYDKEEPRLLRRIERLVVENKLLREALKPFADEADQREEWLKAYPNHALGGCGLTSRDLLNARTALKQEPKT